MIAYQPQLATIYGITFGSQKENGIFKRMNADCTNFISQCVWAGYGGIEGYSLTNPTDIEQLKKLVIKNYRQTFKWFGRNYDSAYSVASTAFIQVEGFWNYMIYNKENGPKAVGYNNGKHWSELTELIEQGDVLQFFHADINRYAHSVMIVSPTHLSLKDSIESAYVAQHTADYSYRPLSDAFLANGGITDAKVRLLKFQPTNF